MLQAWWWVGRGGPGLDNGTTGSPPVGSGNPCHPHHPIPAVFKHGHQTGHRCQLLFTLSLHSAGLHGGPQLRPETGWEASNQLPQPPSPGVTEGLRHPGMSSGLSRGLSRPAPSFRVRKEEVVPEPQPRRGKAHASSRREEPAQAPPSLTGSDLMLPRGQRDPEAVSGALPWLILTSHDFS